MYKQIYTICKTILSYCLKCGKSSESKNPKVARSKNGGIMFLSKFAVYKKSKFIKPQESSALLSSFRIKAPLSKIPLVGPLLFW